MSTHTLTHRRRRATRVATALCLGAALVTGCSAGSGNDSSAPAGAAAPDAAKVADEESRAVGEAGTVSGRRSQALTVREQHLARSATLDLRVADVTKAAAAVRTAAVRSQGAVTSEEISSHSEHGWGQLVVTVPSARLDATLDQLAKVGTVESRTTSTTDETMAYTDTESRIETMRASITRIRQLIERTDDIEQLVTLEGELSTRVADLEALLAQLDAIKGRTTMSPITVSLTEEGAPADPEDGFLAGLAAGWDAFTGSARTTLTALGALTPFALAGGLVLGPPVLWWRRRRRVSPAARPTAGAPAP